MQIADYRLQIADCKLIFFTFVGPKQRFMVKKLSLEVDYSPEYCMLGISCQLQDYKLALNLNSKLGFSFKKLNDLEYSYDQKKDKAPYSIYYFERKAIETDYFLVGNRSEQYFLIPEYKQFDYFFLLKCCDSRREMVRVASKIKDIEQVQTVYLIELKKIKHINYFFNELELHLMKK